MSATVEAQDLVVYGHVHEDRGQWTRGSSVLANAPGMAVPRYAATAFELNLDRRVWSVPRG